MRKFIYSVKWLIHKIPLSWIQVVSIALIGFLVVSDYFSVRSLFVALDYERNDSTIFAITLALFLEGIPFYLGKAWTDYLDKTSYVNNDRVITRLGIIISLVTYVLAASVTVLLRVLYMQKNGGLEGFFNDTYGGANNSNQFIGELLKLCSPILTSLLAFVASWMAFRSSKIYELEKKVNRLREECYLREAEFQKVYQRNRAARASLWSTIADPDMEPMPGSFEVFRQQCFMKIREKLNDTCITTYPTQVERFSARVESKLAECILELSQHSTLPQTISRLTIHDLIQSYEDQNTDDADAWDYDRAGSALIDELERSLNNAVVMAQFTTGGKYRK